MLQKLTATLLLFLMMAASATSQAGVKYCLCFQSVFVDACPCLQISTPITTAKTRTNIFAPIVEIINRRIQPRPSNVSTASLISRSRSVTTPLLPARIPLRKRVLLTIPSHSPLTRKETNPHLLTAGPMKPVAVRLPN